MGHVLNCKNFVNSVGIFNVGDAMHSNFKEQYGMNNGSYEYSWDEW